MCLRRGDFKPSPRFAEVSDAVPVGTYLSESRKGQTSGTGGVEGRSFASAMMCSKVMSV